MSAGCVCCTAIERKASAPKALLVLLFTLTGDKIAPVNIIEALCVKHGAKLESMVYRSLVREQSPTRLPPKRRKVKKPA